MSQPKLPPTRRALLTMERMKRATMIVALVQLSATLAALLGGDEIRGAVAIAFVVIFLTGSAVFLWAFVIAASRSRDEAVSVVGAFFLGDGAIERNDRRWLFGWMASQSVIGLAGAIAQPFTALAFGILVPMFGIGVIAMVGARFGSFERHAVKK